MLSLNTEHSTVSDFIALNTSEIPYFSAYKPDIGFISSKALKYRYFRNIILIGNGGSNTSFNAIYNSLPHDREITVLTTNEASVLRRLSGKYKKEDTLVLVISKSGNTVSVIEAMLYFLNNNYDIIAVTSEGSNALRNIMEKKGLDILPHPDIGGRFSANTSSALFPLALAGIDIAKLSAAMLRQYSQYNANNANQPGTNQPSTTQPAHENSALKFAQTLFALEQRSYTDVFVPVYSAGLVSFLPLITQLMHETFCKQGKGMTFFGSSAPESQHHTNQRIFGGRKNLALVFLRLRTSTDERISVSEDIAEVQLKDSAVSILNGIPYDKALDFEFQGTYMHAIKQNIPAIVITLDKLDEENIASLVVFWQYAAVYSAWLRNINPFDQPEVEYSKDISFKLRKEYPG